MVQSVRAWDTHIFCLRPRPLVESILAIQLLIPCLYPQGYSDRHRDRHRSYRFNDFIGRHTCTSNGTELQKCVSAVVTISVLIQLAIIISLAAISFSQFWVAILKKFPEFFFFKRFPFLKINKKRKYPHWKALRQWQFRSAEQTFFLAIDRNSGLKAVDTIGNYSK